MSVRPKTFRLYDYAGACSRYKELLLAVLGVAVYLLRTVTQTSFASVVTPVGKYGRRTRVAVFVLGSMRQSSPA